MRVVLVLPVVMPAWGGFGIPTREREKAVNKVSAVKLIVKGYFLAAMVGSFTHIIHAAHRTGLAGWEADITPCLIDGMFIISMVMRSSEFAQRTRKIGFRLQVVMGAFSLAANSYAATRLGGYILAGMLVGGMVFGEWLTGQIESAVVESARNALAEAEARKAASIAKGVATKRRNARTRKVETKALENLLAN